MWVKNLILRGDCKIFRLYIVFDLNLICTPNMFCWWPFCCFCLHHISIIDLEHLTSTKGNIFQGRMRCLKVAIKSLMPFENLLQYKVIIAITWILNDAFDVSIECDVVAFFPLLSSVVLLTQPWKCIAIIIIHSNMKKIKTQEFTYLSPVLSKYSSNTELDLIIPWLIISGTERKV